MSINVAHQVKTKRAFPLTSVSHSGAPAGRGHRHIGLQPSANAAPWQMIQNTTPPSAYKHSNSKSHRDIMVLPTHIGLSIAAILILEPAYSPHRMAKENIPSPSSDALDDHRCTPMLIAWL